MRPRLRAVVLTLAPAGLAGALAFAWVPRPARRPVVAYQDRYAVASESAAATRIGIEALRSGGNAVDAAISVALALGVVQPNASGIGGGGFALVWDAKERRMTALDFREVAPAAIDVSKLEDRPKKPVPDGRGAQIGVPGEVAGLAELHRRFGRRTFAEDVAPAASLAEQGFKATAHLASVALAYHEELAWWPPLSALFKPGGWAVGAGARIKNPALAATLRRVGAEGARGFYEGPVAADIARTAQSLGGALTEADLEAYRVVERKPLRIAWEGLDVYTMPPPSAGGLLLAETLGMHGKADLRRLGLGTGAYDHLLAETFRGAIADRMRTIGDPAFVRTDVASLTQRDRLQERRATIGLDRTHPASKFPLEEHGTSHLIVVDEAGNVVSLTTTVNDAFGAMASTESGFVLNDEMMDFTTEAAQAQFAPAGPEHSPNRPRPFARPTSSMTPTIALEGDRLALAVGGAGGLRIATAVTEVFLARTVFGRPVGDCVARARFHTPPEGPVLELDEASPALVDDLRGRGETVKVAPSYSAVQIVAMERGAHGALHIVAAADPRKSGVATVE